MANDGWNLLGGYRLLGGSLGGLVGWNDGFLTPRMVLETGLTLVLVNVKGLWGAGALREPIDSKQVLPSDVDI